MPSTNPKGLSWFRLLLSNDSCIDIWDISIFILAIIKPCCIIGHFEHRAAQELKQCIVGLHRSWSNGLCMANLSKRKNPWRMTGAQDIQLYSISGRPHPVEASKHEKHLTMKDAKHDKGMIIIRYQENKKTLVTNNNHELETWEKIMQCKS